MNPIFLAAIAKTAVESLICECPCCHYRWMSPEGKRSFTMRCANCGTTFTYSEDREVLVSVVKP